MQFTLEQEAIIASTGNIKINAVAGSGKTTTVVAYARSRPADARILYLAFNKSVRQEASRKFAEQGLRNVQVETAHSLAFRHVMKHSGYQLHENGGYKPYELAELLKLPKMADAKAHAEYVLASHIGKFLAYFCNSSKRQVQELNYLDTVADPKAHAFVRTHYALIERSCRVLLKKMNAGEIPITHDFYLKRFQLNQPQLAFDYILFDEGQDASGVMLDFFLRQDATKVIVGDTHQQIYGWRHAVNALEKSDFTTYQLSTSFRFGAPVADLATQVLTWKTQLGAESPFPLTGHGGGTGGPVSKAVISRTNINLLAKAIEYLTHHDSDVQRLYFEGNLNSYTYADTGGSLFDVLSLYNGRTTGIRDPLIRRMANLYELEEYARETEDGSLLMLINLVEEYGNELPGLVKELKRRQVADGARHLAQLCFSTVHKSKGLEYDAVQLTDDFVTPESIDRLVKEMTLRPVEPGLVAQVMEEVNLLYVALTRAKNVLYMPAGHVPHAFTCGGGITAIHGGTPLVSPPLPPPAPALRKQAACTAHSAADSLQTQLESLQSRLDAV